MTRLKELREFYDYTQAECAKASYISLKSYTRYEAGTRILPLDTAAYLAKLFNVSIDYLAGLTNDKRKYW